MRYMELKRKIQTVGTWYFATFIGDVLVNYKDLQDSVKKQHFMDELQKTAAGGEIAYDSTVSKVNTMLAVIRAGKVIEALQIIVDETNPNKVPQETLECASAMIKYINEGKIPLPDLDD